MAKYTITIKDLIKNNFDFKMTDYEIFDEGYRDTLNKKILNHYFLYEIGFETAGLFRNRLNQKLNEIMPMYNILYEVQNRILKEDVLANVNLTEEFNRKSNANTKSSSDTKSTSKGNSQSDSTNKGEDISKNVFQDTPQGRLKYQDINNYDYASNITLNKNNVDSSIIDKSSSASEGQNKITSESDVGNIDKYIKKIVGSNGNKYLIDVLMDIKNNILNIDLMIINDLNDLFMGIM